MQGGRGESASETCLLKGKGKRETEKVRVHKKGRRENQVDREHELERNSETEMRGREGRIVGDSGVMKKEIKVLIDSVQDISLYNTNFFWI